MFGHVPICFFRLIFTISGQATWRGTAHPLRRRVCNCRPGSQWPAVFHHWRFQQLKNRHRKHVANLKNMPAEVDLHSNNFFIFLYFWRGIEPRTNETKVYPIYPVGIVLFDMPYQHRIFPWISSAMFQGQSEEAVLHQCWWWTTVKPSGNRRVR